MNKYQLIILTIGAILTVINSAIPKYSGNHGYFRQVLYPDDIRLVVYMVIGILTLGVIIYIGKRENIKKL